ncbi:phytoene/squalene synthase family protein [Flavobacterium sediminilitoris]|uniref:Phytoene/squalene synthase family protein n=1 Tax=Flavobacterium sediminilitoris TaxID=2024526 RepID=A0ABY4HP37_9FLAO|nr:MULTISPECIES: phytoene/squalene synthase family protein [Flavobacterium]UOX34006.1 phytoene/squalene synthase family protein [Flavobacterium sediminilitoris]
MKALFDQASLECSKKITKKYSTSFSLAIKMLSPDIQDEIYAIYGFVRCADEIVDSFEGYEQETLLDEFEKEYQKALDRKISLNPILNAFQKVVHQYGLHDLVPPFMHSMRMDLTKKEYTSIEEFETYIFGSADVVGLMCLKVFVKGDETKYNELKHSAMKLGSAFQKVNFLRDLKHDYENLGRIYFPGVNFSSLTNENKKQIVAEINADFEEAFKGILKLPTEAKFGVYTAYRYYKSLMKKINKTEPEEFLSKRIRVSNPLKLLILGKSYVRYQLNIIA